MGTNAGGAVRSKPNRHMASSAGAPVEYCAMNPSIQSSTSRPSTRVAGAWM